MDLEIWAPVLFADGAGTARQLLERVKTKRGPIAEYLQAMATDRTGKLSTRVLGRNLIKTRDSIQVFRTRGGILRYTLPATAQTNGHQASTGEAKQLDVISNAHSAPYMAATPKPDDPIAFLAVQIRAGLGDLAAAIREHGAAVRAEAAKDR
jgi:hypothetical protein